MNDDGTVGCVVASLIANVVLLIIAVLLTTVLLGICARGA